MRRILVVDDDLHVGLAIRAWLAQHSFRVTIADGGTNGLAALDTSNFDVMIIDDFTSMAATLGATRCLRKPFRPVTLLTVIDECLSAAEPHQKYGSQLVCGH